jgi:hypothetical protein
MRHYKIVLFVVLVSAMALTACAGQSMVRMPDPPAGPAIQGEDVAAGRTRLYSDPQQRNLVFEIDNGRVYQGTRQEGQAVLFFNGSRIFRGANTTGEILFNVQGERIFVGPNATGPLAYTVRGGRVYEGNDRGPIIYTISDTRGYGGANTTGNVVFESNIDLSGDILFLIPILGDRRF